LDVTNIFDFKLDCFVHFNQSYICSATPCW